MEMPLGPLVTGLVKTLATLQSAKRDTLLTTLLLLEIGDPELRTDCLESIRKGLARIDEKLVLGLYSTGDDEVKLAIARSLVTGRMRPRAFRRVFDPVYARADLSVQQRWDLVWNLEHFLYLNPRQGPAYERIVFELAHSPHLDLRVRGIPMAAQFERIDPTLLALFERALRSRSPHIRLTTINAFGHLVDRLNRIAPDIRDFIVSGTFRKTVTGMHQSDPNEDVRTGAWNLLKRLRT